MEILIAAVVGLIVAVACVALYQKGVSDGMNIARGEKPEPITHDFVAPKNEEPSKDGIEAQYENFMNYQPKFVEERHAD